MNRSQHTVIETSQCRINTVTVVFTIMERRERGVFSAFEKRFESLLHCQVDGLCCINHVKGEDHETGKYHEYGRRSFLGVAV